MDDNNNEDHCVTYDVVTIGNQSDEIKLNFIENVIAQTEIPSNFAPDWKTNKTRKIFFRIKDKQEHKREWLLFENNKFYCAYCLCFALRPNQLVNGIEYVQGARITDNLNKHDKAPFHNHAIGIYSKLIADSDAQQETPQSVSANAKRSVLRCIIKIIIFIATHGNDRI